jgi:hypothetical protein
VAGSTADQDQERDMKTATTTALSFAVAAMFLTGALAGPAAAGEKGEKHDKQVPFSGSVQGRENDVFHGPPPGTLSVDGNGKGIATHLGRMTLAWTVTVNLANGMGTGFAQLIAANGDSIYTTLVGQGEPTDTPGVNRIVEINTITGGTGRFSDAAGSFTLERLVDLTTGFTSGSFHGTISSPGGRR